MKVSVIVPVYNTAPYLNRCLQSLCSQTHRDIEILLVNDGSTDESPAICQSWVEKDARVRYFTQENSGLSSARNTGIANAQGEYLCFVDSDDCVSPFFVEKLLGWALEYNTKISCCGYVLADETTQPEQMAAPLAEYAVEVLNKKDFFARVYTDKEILYIVVWNRLYHRSIFDNVRFEEGRLHEDEGIMHHIIGQCERIAMCYEPLYFYTVRQGSIMKTAAFGLHKLDILPFWEDRMEYFTSMGWPELCWLTMRNYLVKCLELYNCIDKTTPDGKLYRVHLMRLFSQMLAKAKRHSVQSKRFLLQMRLYGLFPSRFKNIDRTQFLFEN